MSKKNDDGMKKQIDDTAKKDDGSFAVFKVDMHCHGCAMKLKNFAKKFPGVLDVTADFTSNKLTVTGNVDALKLRDSLAQKTKKKVELLTPLPKKPDEAAKKPQVKVAEGDKSKASATEKPKDVDKPKEVPPQDIKKAQELAVVNAVFKTRLHCEGCINKIRKIVSKYKGVLEVSFDTAKEIVMVKGAVDEKVLQTYMKQKLRREVELIPAKKEEKKEEKNNGKKEGKKSDKNVEMKEGKNLEKKEENKDGNKSEKKEKAEEKKPEEKKGKEKKVDGEKAMVVESPTMGINQMHYYGYPYSRYVSYWYGDEHVYALRNGGYYGPVPALPSPPMPVEGKDTGYVIEQYQPPPYVYAPQMFSEENPNACSIM